MGYLRIPVYPWNRKHLPYACNAGGNPYVCSCRNADKGRRMGKSDFLRFYYAGTCSWGRNDVCFPYFRIMLVDVAGAIIVIGCLLPIPLPHISTNQEATHFINDLKQGFFAVKNNKPLMAAFFPVIFASLLYMPLGSLFPLLVRLYYKGGAGHNALVEFAFSAGLLVSSTIM